MMITDGRRSVEAIACRCRWTADDAAVVLEAAEQSGLTLGGFAAMHGLDAQRLYRWSRALRREARSVEPVQFEEVAVRPTHERARPASAASIELLLRSGHVVRLGADFDGAALRRLLSVLEEDSAC